VVASFDASKPRPSKDDKKEKKLETMFSYAKLKIEDSNFRVSRRRVRPITANPNLSPKAYHGGLNDTTMSPIFTKLVPIEMISAEDFDYQDVKQKSKNQFV
jgi:hypothetical protein